MSSKVAAYLQEHILGEVVTDAALLEHMSHDASVLEVKPEIIVYPRVTNDIRKVARFAWQLAEKGNILPITARGAGTDQTGAAIGKGIVLSFTAHMNNILEFDQKQKLVRVQPGVNAKALNDALALHGLGIPAMPRSAGYSTIGGAVANNASGSLSGKYGSIADWVAQLEVVLANGDLIQTGRMNKRELNKKKGLQTFEGEIYRNLDNLIEDNKQLIDEKLGGDVRDNLGYNALSQVKQKDGSLDLTPLFIGSQGTLGVISEMILKSDFVGMHMGAAVLAFTEYEAARDMMDELATFAPAFLEFYDGELFQDAGNKGRQYTFTRDIAEPVIAVVVLGFDDFNEHARRKKLKKVTKMAEDRGVYIQTADGEEARELLAVREVTAYRVVPGAGLSAPPLFDGAYIPRERLDYFLSGVAELAAKHHVSLPIYGSVLENIYSARPVLHLKKVGDKQKIFKLLDEYGKLVDQHGGHLIAEAGEGRMKARFAYAAIDDDVAELFASIKLIFDPNGILNPGVKQVSEVRQLVSQLRADYDIAAFSDYTLH